ncbi:MAG: hypothetical protein LBH13_00045 [Cellulomonadaceae bacterium]|jgi:hypothetical protein|nr:hypothetical protein [Cellulomonadaceae bacterium]
MKWISGYWIRAVLIVIAVTAVVTLAVWHPWDWTPGESFTRTATAAAAIIGAATGAAVAIVGIGTLVQRSRTDRREEWWRRYRWALEESGSSTRARRRIGYAVLETLATSQLAGPTETGIIDAVTQSHVGLVASWDTMSPQGNGIESEGL